MEINPDELREFLEADLLGAQADPEFKEGLRRKLWTLVRTKYGSGKPRTTTADSTARDRAHPARGPVPPAAP